jgi:hypothetical protein
MKNTKYHTVGTTPKSNIKRGNIDILSTQIHNRALSRLGTDTSDVNTLGRSRFCGAYGRTISGIMVSVFPSSVVDRWFEPRSGHTKKNTIGIVASPL